MQRKLVQITTLIQKRDFDKISINEVQLSTFLKQLMCPSDQSLEHQSRDRNAQRCGTRYAVLAHNRIEKELTQTVTYK